MAKLNTDEDRKAAKAFLKEWLEKLQQESWQLELLISGFALFGIYEARSWIDNLVLAQDTFGYSSVISVANFFELLAKGGWDIFFINLLAHVILRGLWIGAIGLRYVSQDIDYDSLDYSEQFTKFLKRKVGDYDDFIERLEKICSVLFAYTFLLFLLLLSLLMFMTVFFVMMYISVRFGTAGQPNMIILLLAFAYFIFGLIVFVDFISLGGLKRIKEPIVSKIYMYFYTFYSTLTLSFLYRPLLYNFIDDKYTRRLFYLSIPYIFIVLFSNNLFSNEGFPYWSADEAMEQGLHISKLNYEDERMKWYNENDMKKELNKEKLPPITLSQLMNDQPYLEIFIKMIGNDQYLLEAEDGLSPFKKPGINFTMFSSETYDDPEMQQMRKARKQETKEMRSLRQSFRSDKRKADNTTELGSKIDSITKEVRAVGSKWKEKEDQYRKQKLRSTIEGFLGHNRLSIDDSPINKEMDCFKYRHPNFGEYGLLCMYYTDTLARGQHLISLERDYYRRSTEELETETFKVPFYKIK